MSQLDLNEVPEILSTGKMSEQQVINELAVFILNNTALFGLQTKDDDFKNDVITIFLERGPAILHKYNSDLSSFFTYFYLCIKSLAATHKRALANAKTKEYHTVSECISNYEIKAESYKQINYHDFEIPKIPYAYKPVSYKALQIACKSNEYGITKLNDDDLYDDTLLDKEQINAKLLKINPLILKKILVVLALKSSFYITDRQVEKICLICQLDKTNFQDIIQTIKENMHNRENNKNSLENRRNKAYYHHAKYKSLLDFDTEMTKTQKQEMERKMVKQTANWINLNHQLEKGKILIRPTTKLISQILGMSERQIHYYQRTAKQLGLDVDVI